jgi:hypothetical protein
MSSETISADYLVVGAGAGGMAFADALIADCDRKLVIVDRRHAPAGHWHDAYPFVRLHVPSAQYGVNSLVLGRDTIDEAGPNRGLYEQASAAEICAYYDLAMKRLLASGRVRFFAQHEYEAGPAGSHYLVSRLNGERREVVVSRKLIDATYLQGPVASTHRRSFEAAEPVRCVPINQLATLATPAPRYVVLGSGKSGIDACLWLLAHDVPPERIRWVRPREPWLLDRRYYQPLAQVHIMYEGFVRQAEAAADAADLDDLFSRLESAGQVARIDNAVTPTMYRCATVSEHELEQLRRVRDVVRLGRVKRIEPRRILLEQGEVAAGPDDLYVDCTAVSFLNNPSRPIFERERITLQAIRTCNPCFNSALIGHLEATRDDLDEKNRLCPPNPYPSRPEDWLRMFVTSGLAQFLWSQDQPLNAWMEGARLNVMRGLAARRKEPAVRAATLRMREKMGPAMQNMQRLQAALSA